MKRLFICCCLALMPTFGWPQAAPAAQKKSTPKPAYNYPQNPYVTQEVWDMVKPYFLPSNHPVKSSLDKIFSSKRVTQNATTVMEAGFPRFHTRAFSLTTVSKHPNIKGHLVKMFTDDLWGIEDYLHWISRIEGARSIQASIDAHGYKNFFKVPKKWIYPLPAEPSPPEGHFRKNFILVVEDMDIYHRDHNFDKWRSDRMTKKRADALYTVLQENGLHDCVYPFNIPFCHDGKQAFIDTERHHVWPVYFDITLQFLSPRMVEYWTGLIHNGGPKSKK